MVLLAFTCHLQLCMQAELCCGRDVSAQLFFSCKEILSQLFQFVFFISTVPSQQMVVYQELSQPDIHIDNCAIGKASCTFSCFDVGFVKADACSSVGLRFLCANRGLG